MKELSNVTYWYVPISIKVLAALLTSISLSLIVNIMNYVPLEERAEHTYYYPFGYTLSISILISLAVLLFLILPLSIFADKVIVSQKINGPVAKVILVIVTYFLMGLCSGLLFSIFVFKWDAFEYTGPYPYLIITAFVFLLWQLGLKRLLSSGRGKSGADHMEET